MDEGEAQKLTAYLLSLSKECEWVEYKHNLADPDRIGEYISALSNSAALAGQPRGFVVWGVGDADSDLLGTSFRPETCRKGNQPLEISLAASLNPRTLFEFVTLKYKGKDVVLLAVDAAHGQPVKYRGKAYVRVGEAKTELSAHPDRERKLWLATQTQRFESRDARSGLSADEVISLLEYSKYFDLLSVPLPDNKQGILDALQADSLISQSALGWSVSIAGAILFGKGLDAFPLLQRKGVRVVAYSGNDRVKIRRQQAGNRGYAAGFEGLVAYIDSQLPEEVDIGPAFRTSTPTFPEVAVRELVANALIHQDLSIPGAGPLIEIFDTRIEISNPGHPLVPPERFADMPPRSRNEKIASLMRRMGMCEELGSGIDRVLSLVEASQLPAPEFTAYDDSFRVTLYSAKSFASLSKEERVRACYWHAVFLHLQRKQMTNSTLRERFNIEAKNQSQVSRVIADALDAKLIRRDPPGDMSKRHAKYVPAWA